jgi:GNAT superfamily N-acetyltransferase
VIPGHDENGPALLQTVVDPPLTPALRGHLLDMWVRVTNRGGSVGFVPPVVPADIRPTAERSFARVESGTGSLVCLATREPVPVVVGWLMLAESESHLRRHWRTVYHVQVDPQWQGAGVGAELMATAARYARDGLGLEALTLMTRSGTGAERFYKRCGYREVGRIPGAIRVEPGDDRDEVHFWLDL